LSCVALMTTQMWPIWPSGDPQFDMPGLDRTLRSCNQQRFLAEHIAGLFTYKCGQGANSSSPSRHHLLFSCNDYSKPKANQEIIVFVRDDYSCHGAMSSHQLGCKYKYNGFFPHVTSTVSTGFPRTIATALVLVLLAQWDSQSVRSLDISCLREVGDVKAYSA